MKSSTPKSIERPASEQAMEHLQNAHDAIVSKIGSVKKLSIRAITDGKGKSQTITNLAQRARSQADELANTINSVEKLLYKTAQELSDSDVKPVLVEAAKALQQIIMLEKGAQGRDEYKQHVGELLGLSGRVQAASGLDVGFKISSSVTMRDLNT